MAGAVLHGAACLPTGLRLHPLHPGGPRRGADVEGRPPPPPLAIPASLKPVLGSARQALTSREEAMEKARGRIGGMRSSR